LLETCIDLESDPAMVRAVRQFVDRTVSEWELDPVREDARLIATELAGNAVLHARTEFRVTLRSNGFGFLRIEVRDDNSRMPMAAGPPEGATSGRGLAVVSALATSWGTQQDGEGKVVWAELGHPGPADEPECLDLSDLAAMEDLEPAGETEEPAQGA
jgi:anti-sigma regulatory factor (Ser/Thr protein kinase)